jgi:protein ImuB
MGFACIYVPDFLVQAVVRGQCTLGESALALLSGAPPLWSVVAANAAAFDAGIQLGMTKAQVAQFHAGGAVSGALVGTRDTHARSSQVQICFRSEAQEQAAHAALLDVAWSVSPRVEDTAADTILLDLDGLNSLFGSEENIAQELKRRVAAMGLAARVAVAANIEVAIHAARGFPGITIIPLGQERQRLGVLPVGVLTAEVETVDVLERWGIATLQALAALPVLQLSERLGQEGVRLSELARGVRQRALVLAQPSSTFAEEMELDDAVEELEPLSFLLGRLLDQLCARLEARVLAARAIRVRFQLQPSFEKDFQVFKEEVRTKPPVKHYEKSLTLPVPIRNAKTLLKLLRLQLQSDPPAAPIQKIYMTADTTGPRVTQNGLFVPTGPDPEKLEVTIARLAKLVGPNNVGRVQLEDSHRPESFRLEHFTTAPELRGTEHPYPHRPPAKNVAPASFIISSNSGPTASIPPSLEKSTVAVTALRIIRPPQPLRVDSQNGQPVRVYLHGLRGEVITASGPWRSSGDWWQEDPWRQDEWDLEIEFPASSLVGAQLYPEQRRGNAASVPRQGESDQPQPDKWSRTGPQRGLYRVYFDALRQTWFLRGEYD